MGIRLRVLALGFAVLMAASPAEAKNLNGRVGFGLNVLNFTHAYALSLKYFHDPLVASAFQFGFSTVTETFLIGGRLSRNVVLEENLNLYLAIAGMFQTSKGTPTGTGVEFDGLFGGEFFMAGLPNLAFQFDVGVGLRTLGGTSFQSVVGAGVHYYF